MAGKILPIALLILVLGAACGSNSDDDSWSAEALGRRAQGQSVSPIVANSAGTLAVGKSRLSIAFFDGNGGMVHDIGEATLRLFALDDSGEGTFVQEALMRRSQLVDEDHHQSSTQPADHPVELVADVQRPGTGFRALQHDDPLATLLVAQVSFNRSGWWGVEIDAWRGGDQVRGLRTRLFVSEESEAPMIGDLVPRTKQTVLSDVSDISEIDTSRSPNPLMHQMTVADALDSGVPVVIGLTTPLFCQTRFCGPVLEQALRPILGRYAHNVAVLHIEPFDVELARSGELVPIPMMAEWGLESEPWVFVVDADGRLAARFEGVVTEEELVEVIDALLEQSLR